MLNCSFGLVSENDRFAFRLVATQRCRKICRWWKKSQFFVFFFLLVWPLFVRFGFQSDHFAFRLVWQSSDVGKFVGREKNHHFLVFFTRLAKVLLTHILHPYPFYEHQELQNPSRGS